MGITDHYYDLLEFARTFRARFRNLIGSFRSSRKRGVKMDLRAVLRRMNVYRRAREALVSRYLSRTVFIGKKDKDAVITWQPFLYVAIKIGLAAYAASAVFGLYPYVGRGVEWLIRFFRLHEIYNFDIPGPVILNGIGQWVLAVVILLFGFSFAVYQVVALFSSFVVIPARRRAYYIKNSLLRKELFIFSLSEMDHCVLKQNPAARLIGIGTIELRIKSGYSVRIASLKNASLVMKHLVLAKAGEAR